MLKALHTINVFPVCITVLPTMALNALLFPPAGSLREKQGNQILLTSLLEATARWRGVSHILSLALTRAPASKQQRLHPCLGCDIESLAQLFPSNKSWAVCGTSSARHDSLGTLFTLEMHFQIPDRQELKRDLERKELDRSDYYQE